MRILLIRPKYGSIFSFFAPVITEPLELEYLGAVATSENCQWEIIDHNLSKKGLLKKIESYKPDLIAITGYITARDIILRACGDIKEVFPDIKTVVGGVHAEINYEEFYHDQVDFIVYSGGSETFRALIKSDLSIENCSSIDGICLKAETGNWKKTSYRPLDLSKLPHPDRTYFYENLQKFRYLHYGPVAMVKSAWGCLFNCNFCFCRLLYNGKYVARDLEDVVDEIEAIQTEIIWIIDDTFLISKKKVVQFAELIKKRGIKKKFIVYSRADFIANNRELLPLLREIGIIDVIVGLEAVDDSKLNGYNKENSALQNQLCIEYLKEADIKITALFMMNIDAKVEDFRKLDSWVVKMGLKVFTVSVFLPLPGTELFEQYKDRLTTNDIAKWDFLHLVVEPENISRTRFYYELIRLYTRMVLRFPKLITEGNPNLSLKKRMNRWLK